MKMSDLHIELTADTNAAARKARIVSKHLQAMADELDLAKGLEEGAPTRCAQCGWVLRPGAGHRFRDGLYCTYCYGSIKTELERALAQTESPNTKDEPVKCAYCGKRISPSEPQWGDVNLNGAYCSKGCVEMAGMEQKLPVRSGCGARWPSGTWGQSCLEHCTCIDKVADTVILRLRDYHRLEV